MAIFKYVHASRRTYNDLKPDNVMLNFDSDGEPVVCLIDFGLSAKILKSEELKHVDQDELQDKFEGNMLFSSLNQMEFKRTSRRDDLTSLFYMMTYLLNDNILVGSQGPQITDQEVEPADL